MSSIRFHFRLLVLQTVPCGGLSVMGNSQPRERMKKTDFSGCWCVERLQSRTTGERRTDCSHCRLVTQRKNKWLSVCDNLICALKLTNILIKRNKLGRSSSKNWLSRNTGNSLHTAFSLVHPNSANSSIPAVMPNFVAQSETGSWRRTYSRTGNGALRLGDGGGRRCGAVPSDLLPVRTSRDGEDHAAAEY